MKIIDLLINDKSTEEEYLDNWIKFNQLIENKYNDLTVGTIIKVDKRYLKFNSIKDNQLPAVRIRSKIQNSIIIAKFTEDISNNIDYLIKLVP